MERSSSRSVGEGDREARPCVAGERIRTGGVHTGSTRHGRTEDPSLSCPPPVGFFTTIPCRLFDTRDAPGPFGGPALAASSIRTFLLPGRCGIPSTAKAVSVNVTVAQPSTEGYLALFPGGTPLPGTSMINFRPGQTRANNGIVPLGSGGDVAVFGGLASGTTHVLLDVNGYFE